jgi:hypothetical protein
MRAWGRKLATLIRLAPASATIGVARAWDDSSTTPPITVQPQAPEEVGAIVGKFVGLAAYGAIALGVIALFVGAAKYAYGERDSGRRYIAGGLLAIGLGVVINPLLRWLFT